MLGFEATTGLETMLAEVIPWIRDELDGGTLVTELSVVVPVFKEGEAVEPVLRALDAGIATSHEILVVYDFDEDPTVPVIDRLHAELPSIRGLRNDLGRGVLNAMKAGIAASTGDYVLVSMADGSDEPHVVDAMVELARGGADVVSASRYMKGGHQVGGPPLKRLLSRTAGLTLHWFGGVATHDPTNNFKLYSRRFLDSTTIESDAGFELALELTVKATLDRRARGRGPHDLARSDRRREQLQAPQMAAALLALVSRGATLAHPQEAIDQGLSMASGLATRSWLRRDTGDPALATDGGAYRPDLDGLRAVADRARHAGARATALGQRRRGRWGHRVLRPVRLRHHGRCCAATRRSPVEPGWSRSTAVASRGSGPRCSA